MNTGFHDSSAFLCPERVHADALALLRRLFEPYLSVDQGEQGVIASYSNVAAWLDHRAALAHEDRPGPNDRALTAFDAESLALAVSTVARATDAFLMCHVMCLCLLCVSGLGVVSLCQTPVRSGSSSSGGGPASPADAGRSVSASAAVSAAAVPWPARPSVVGAVSSRTGSVGTSERPMARGSATAASCTGAADVEWPSSTMSVMRRPVSPWRGPFLR